MRILTIAALAALWASCSTPRCEPRFAEFAHATPQRDTLFLLQSDSHTETLMKLWNQDTIVKRKPCIRLVTENEMASIKKRLSYDKKN